METALTKFITRRVKKLEVDLLEYDYPQETIESVVESEKNTINQVYKAVKDTVENKEDEKIFKLYKYFENICNNRIIAFAFKDLTGLPVGQTNKSGIRAFNEFFGEKYENEILAKRESELRKEQEAKEKEKLEEKRKEQEELDTYFSLPLWDKNKVSKLTKMQFGRVKKSLDKLFRFNGVVRTLKEQLEHEYKEGKIEGKKVKNNMYKWNARKFNRMDGEEQREYNKKLLNGRNYNVDYNKSTREVPKIVFDILNIKDTTNTDELEVA